MSMETQKNDHVFRSKLPNIDIPNNITLHTYCFQNLAQFNHKPCLIDTTTDTTYTYGQVHVLARRTAAALASLGVKKGDVVMLLLSNVPEFVFAFLGASILGGSTTGVNPAFTSVEIAKHAASSGAKVLLTVSSASAEKVKDLAGVTVVFVDVPPFSKLLESGNDYIINDEEIDPKEDIAALPYSSGTTGLPKGVMVTHEALVTNIAQQVDGHNPNLYINSHDVIICVLPLFHIYALNSILLCGLRVGAAIVLVAIPRFDVFRVLGLVEKYKVTVAPFVPPIISAVVNCSELDNFNVSSLRMVITGGAPMGRELEVALKERLPKAIFGQGYGMTEAGSVSMCLAFSKEPFPVKSGSCGTIIRNAELKVVDTQTGVSLPRNKVGEICIRGNQIMKGFLNNIEATKDTIDEDGWLHSGDIGYVDDDDELFIVDRLKELIKYKGFQVAPAELEALLIAHPHINDAAVIPMKDETAGEVPVAFVVRSSSSNISEEDIKMYIAKQVVFYKRINRVFFIDKLTKSPSGKIVRKDLRLKLEAEAAN